MRSYITQLSVWQHEGSVRLYWQCGRGNENIPESHLYSSKLSFGIINSSILCVYLRKFLVDRSSSFCFIVLQNQSPCLLLTISGRRIFSNHLKILVEYTLEYCASAAKILCKSVQYFLFYIVPRNQKLSINDGVIKLFSFRPRFYDQMRTHVCIWTCPQWHGCRSARIMQMHIPMITEIIFEVLQHKNML